ncbi:MAG: hypothetical protein OCC49_05750 [Fibrobacterales bacterium]
MRITPILISISLIAFINCNFVHNDENTSTQVENSSSDTVNESSSHFLPDDIILDSSDDLISSDHGSSESSSEPDDESSSTPIDRNSDTEMNEYCKPKDAVAVGDCSEEFGAKFNGTDCELVTGCSCEGEDCDDLYNDLDHCYFYMDYQECGYLFEESYCWAYGEKFLVEDTVPTASWSSRCRADRLVCGEEGDFYKTDPEPCVMCTAPDGAEVYEEETYFDGCETYTCTLEGTLELIENDNITCGVDRVTYPDACSNPGLLLHEGDCNLSDDFEQLSQIVISSLYDDVLVSFSQPTSPMVFKQTVSIQPPFEEHRYFYYITFNHSKHTVTIKKEDEVESNVIDEGTFILFDKEYGASAYTVFESAYRDGDIFHANTQCEEDSDCDSRYFVEFLYIDIDTDTDEGLIIYADYFDKDVRILINEEFLQLMQEYIEKSE